MARKRSKAVTCPWCGHYYGKRPERGDCNNCGGPLPPAHGDGRGAAPPPPPRTIPEAYKRRVRLNGNVFTILGIVFVPLGVLMTAIQAIIYVKVPHMPFVTMTTGLVFVVMGVPMLLKGIAQAKRKLAALERGLAAEAEVISVSMNTSVRINNRSPWVIAYAFDAGGSQLQGSAETYKAEEGDHERGDPIWVVCLPEDPSVNTVWPPIA